MSQIDRAEMVKIPFLDHANIGGRTIPTLFFHVDGNWQGWVAAGGRLIPMKGWPAEACYFAVEPEAKDDICFAILNFIGQRCLIPPVLHPYDALLQDFYNLGACVRKFDLLFEQSKSIGTSTSRLVITELEYLFAICRSIFDLLQEIISVQWDSVKLHDPLIKKKQLPKKFSDMAMKGDAPRSEAELMDKYGLPAQLATFYTRRAPFFQMLRAFRDQLIHHGRTPEYVFVTERGFAMAHDRKPFADFGVWNEEHMLPNKLCSLRPAIGYAIRETIRACEDYAVTVQSIIEFPPPVAPNMNFFMRGYFNQALLDCLAAVDTCAWWADPV